MSVANTTIRIRKSLVSGNVPSVLANGEIAINQVDGKLFYSTPSGSISYITNSQSFATVNANSSLILAVSPTDTLSIVPGTNITISACTVTKSITINAPVAGGSTPLDDTITSKSTTSAGTANSVNTVYTYAQTLSNKTFIFRQNTAPSTSNTSDLWLNIDTGVMYENFGNTSIPVWAEFGPSGQLSNTQPGVVTGTIVYSNGVDLLSFSQQSFDKANTASSNTVYTQGVDATQNTNIQSAWNKANNALANATGIFSGDLTTTGNTTVNKQLFVNYTPPVGVNSAIEIVAANTKGGAGYGDFLTVTNTSGGTTNPKKFFRINQTGGLEIIDNNYLNNLFELTNAGDVTIRGNTTINGINASYAPNRPAFRVYGANTTNALTTTQNGTGVLNYNNWAVDYNQGSYLNISTGIFTAPVAGLYQVNVVARNSGYAGGISQICALKNSSIVIMVEWAASSTMNHTGGSTIVKLSVGDTLKLQVTGGQVTFDSNDNWSVAYIG